jgi:phosphoglycolate phosphatase/putative hydrolase of the HAD superfamily
VLFDLDGTLYNQLPLRGMMILMLVFHYGWNPGLLIRNVKIIAAYRRAQERMRRLAEHNSDLLPGQIDMTVEATGESRAYVSATLNEWFETKPLGLLRFCKKRGVDEVLCALKKRGFILGVFSDYPVEDKLNALGIRHYFRSAISSQDEEVNGVKPHTNGFEIAAKQMGLAPEQVIYVGDRADVDGKGAILAGMKPVIINPWLNAHASQGFTSIKTMDELIGQL